MRSIVVAFLCCILASPFVQARDTKHMYSIQDAMESNTYKERLDPDIKLVFGKSGGNVAKSFGTVVTNKKTNAFGKSDLKACEWVLLSALLSLQDRARSDGGNAVVDIASYYKKNKVVSTSEYECHAGAIIAGVALQGKVVTLK